MIVEFIGESGCGKTTLARQVLPRIPDGKKKDSVSARESLRYLARALGDSGTRGLLLSMIRAEMAANGFSRLGKNTLHIAGLFNILLEDRDDSAVWILDQGLVQHSQSVYYETAVDDRYLEIMRKLMESGRYYIVFCHCDPETLRERISQRAKSVDEPIRRIERADEAVFRLHERNFQTLLSVLGEESYISVDTAEDLRANADRVCAFIQSRRDRSCEQKRPF